MTVQIKNETFNPATEFVDIAGSFNGWGATLHKLTDEDADSIYTIEIDGFLAGQDVHYKFRFNSSWDGREEFAGGGSNRFYKVVAENNSILVWYNNEPDPDDPPVADFKSLNTEVSVNSLAQFQDQSWGEITSRKWLFEGGTPSESQEEDPLIRYTETGTFDVELIVFNEEVSDTLHIEDYITVSEPETGETKWWNESVFYEIFVRSFYDSDGDGIGDFNGLTQKLDYLNDGNPDTDTDLGITGIWLMPIHDSPTYHGYDVIDYRSINPDYGTIEDFKTFLEAAQERGISVIIDFVMNHSSTEHPWFKASAAGDPHFRDFYRWSDTHPGYNGPWGQNVWHSKNDAYYYGLFWGGMPDLNYDNPALKDSMFAIADFWISDIGIDGFRQDAVLYIDEDGSDLKNTDGTLQFWQDFNTHVKSLNPDAFNVGEAWEPTDIVLDYISDNRLDYAFEFDLAQAILNGVNSGERTPIISQMQNVYDAYPFLQYGTFLTNHDQDRVMNTLDGNIDKAKLAASLYLTLPGIPYLYYGEEVGMLGKKPDEDIRLPMQWNTETNAGFTSGTPWRSVNSNFAEFNVEVMQEDEKSLFNQYRKFIHLRESHSAFQVGEMEIGAPSNLSVFSFARFGENLTPVLVASNLSDEVLESDITFSYEAVNNNPLNYDYFEILVTENDGWGTSETSANFWSLKEVTFEPRETKVYALRSGALSTEENSNIESFYLFQNYPNPFNPSTNISFTLPRASEAQLRVYDITGRLVVELLNEKRNSGSHSVTFDASALSSGVYFYRLEAGEFQSTQKMTLIK